MARPQKFRHSREALTDPQIAAKLGALVLDIETLRMKRKQIDDQIAAAYDAVDDAGFEKKFVRKTIALRAKEEGARSDEEQGLEAYEFAVEKGVSLVCARRDRNLPTHDPITGEITDTQEQPVTATQSEPAAQVRDELVDLSLAGTAAWPNNEPAGRSSDESPRINPTSTGAPLDAGCTAPSESAADAISESAHPSHEPVTAGEGAPPPALSPATNSDDDVPAFLKQDKPGCLKLRNGHCKIGFATEALCAECAHKRTRELA